MSKASVKAVIDAAIKQNGTKSITGPVLNSVLNQMVDEVPDVVNDVTTGGTGKALSAEQGKNLGTDLSQLSQKIDEFAQGKFYGYFGDASELPAGEIPGFAYVGTEPPFAIYNYDGETWTDSGLTVNDIPVGNGEDIDFNAGGLLQFANRAYDAQDPNGMGYVILRKNKTFVEQVTVANTIYEIRYDFALTANFTLPNNCVLLFCGGKIYGGNEVTLTANGCKIDGDKCISGICLSGASVLCSSWFIDSVSFKNSIIRLLNNASVYFDSDITLPKGAIYFPDGISFYGKGDYTVSFEDTTVGFYVSNNCSFYNCNFDGTGSGKQEQDNHREVIRSDGKSNIKIVGCSFKNFYGGNRMIVIHLNNSDANNAKENFVISDCVFDHYGSYNPDDTGSDPDYVSRAIWISGNCKHITINNCRFSNQRNVSLSGEDISTYDADAICIDGDLNGDSYDMFAEIADNYFENIYTCPIKTFASYLIVQNNRSIQNKHCNILICRCYNGRNVQILNNSCVSSDERFTFVIQVKSLNNVTIANNRCETTATYAESALSLVNSTGIVVDGFSFIGKSLLTENSNDDTEYLFGGSVYDDILIKNVVAVVGRRTAITRFSNAAHKITFDNVTIVADYVLRPFNTPRGELVFEYVDCRINISSWGDSASYAKVIAERCSFNFVTVLFGDGEFRNCSLYAVTTYGANLKLINFIIPVFDRNLIYIISDAVVLIDGLNVGEKTSNDYYLIRVDGADRQNYVDIKNVNVLFAQGVSNDSYYLVKGNGSGFIRWGQILSVITRLMRGPYANMPSNTLHGFKYLATDSDANGGVYENVCGSIIKIS